MTHYVIWRRGIKGPSIAVLISSHLDQYERENKITDPIEISDTDAELPLSALEQLYPPPMQYSEIDDNKTGK